MSEKRDVGSRAGFDDDRDIGLSRMGDADSHCETRQAASYRPLTVAFGTWGTLRIFGL